MMEIFMLIATHKEFDQVVNDDCYHVMKNGSIYKSIDGYLKDDIGDNVSAYQPLLCELSSLYCTWKNYEYDVLGLCHYRRYFAKDKKDVTSILSKFDIINILDGCDLIVPKPSKYFFITPTEYYIRFHNKKTTSLRKHYIDLLSEVISSEFPEYKKSMEIVFGRKYAHLKNMFIMRKDLANKYCEFLFGVLFALDKREKFRERALGTVGEFLIDIWIEKNNISYIEMPIYSEEDESAINKLIRKIVKKN